MKKTTRFLILVTMVMSGLSLRAQNTQTPDTLCAGASTYYKIASANSGSTYDWGIYQSQGTITSGNGTDSIRVSWDNTVGTDSIWVAETNVAGCSSDTAVLVIVRHTAPTATFNKAALCYGDTLKVNLTGTAPWNLVYSQNGSNVSQSGIYTASYILSESPGSYALVRVADKFCTNSNASGSAVITVPITRPLIVHE